MRRTLSLLIMGIFVTSYCFAQPAAQPAAKPATATPAAAPAKPATMTPTIAKVTEIKNLTGKVESVTIADSTKGTKSEITIADSNGQKFTFLVKLTTTIYDADWKPLTLDKISKDTNVKLKYLTTKEGVNEVSSINLIK